MSPALLEEENRRACEPMKQTVNRVLRCGLVQAAKPVKPISLEISEEQ